MLAGYRGRRSLSGRPSTRTAPTVQNLTTLASLAANATGYPVHDVAGWLLDDSSDLAEPWAGRKAAPNRDDNGVAAVYGNQRTRDLVAAFSDLDQAQQAHVLALVEALSKAS